MACRPLTTKQGTPLIPSRCARRLSACTPSISASLSSMARAASGSSPQDAATAASTGQVTDVAAIGEVGGEQRLHCRVGPAEPRRPAHQPVGVHAGRSPADPVEAELHAFQPPDLGDGAV